MGRGNTLFNPSGYSRVEKVLTLHIVILCHPPTIVDPVSNSFPYFSSTTPLDGSRTIGGWRLSVAFPLCYSSFLVSISLFQSSHDCRIYPTCYAVVG